MNQTLLRDELRWLFWSEFKRLIPFSIGAHSLITHVHPAMIITADDADQRSRAFCLTARTLGVPTLVVQQGITAIDYPEWKFFTADHIAAMGPTSREVLISQGVPAEKITVTGHPGFDCLLAPATNAIEVTRQACNVGPTQKMVLFASQPAYVGAFSSKAIRREMIQAIFGSAEEIADIALIVKPHPSDNLREIKTLAKPFKHTSVIKSNMPISKLIAACDVFVTFFSQTGIEALMAGKPVVNVRFPGSTGDSYYIESGATCLAQTEEELRTMFRLLTGEERKSEMAQRENARMQLLREWTYLPDGRSSQRVRNLINNYLQEMTQQSRN